MNKKFLTAVLATGFIAAGCSDDSDIAETENTAPPAEETVEQETAAEDTNEDDFLTPFDETLTHVHGMGYVGNEDGLYFASHTGLKVYQDGSWFETDGMYNDYMGFNAVDEGFFTSGHPGMDSDLPNPIGIQRSNDGGRSLESLTLEGETDFHWMAAGYQSHDLFVMNPQPNSEMEAGFYFSENEGADWRELAAEGIDGELTALAIHPTDSALLAAASSTGVFLSEDGGESFKRVTEQGEFGTAVHFTEDELLYASHGTEAALTSYGLANGEEERFEIPDMGEDGVIFIAVNPADAEEIALYTVQGSAYVSSDAGATWEAVLEQGQIQ